MFNKLKINNQFKIILKEILYRILYFCFSIELFNLICYNEFDNDFFLFYFYFLFYNNIYFEYITKNENIFNFHTIALEKNEFLPEILFSNFLDKILIDNFFFFLLLYIFYLPLFLFNIYLFFLNGFYYYEKKKNFYFFLFYFFFSNLFLIFFFFYFFNICFIFINNLQILNYFNIIQIKIINNVIFDLYLILKIYFFIIIIILLLFFFINYYFNYIKIYKNINIHFKIIILIYIFFFYNTEIYILIFFLIILILLLLSLFFFFIFKLNLFFLYGRDRIRTCARI
jgi:hypothetical protein